MRLSFTRKHKGAALVELALTLPILLVLMLMVTELCRAMLQYGLITRSVRDAVRYASIQAVGSNATQTRNLVVYGNIDSTGRTALVPGLALANVAAPSYAWTGTAPVINTVTVSVNGFCFQPMVASVFGVALTRPDANCTGIPFGAISATMRAPA